MRLNLALNGILVASATIDPSRCHEKFYMQAMRRLLLQKSQDVLLAMPARPSFYVEVPAAQASQLFQDDSKQHQTENYQQAITNSLHRSTASSLAKGELFSTN